MTDVEEFDFVVLNAERTLGALRWKEDMVVVNDFGEKVWLKPLVVNDRYEHDHNGRRIGITDCCFADDPCLRHAILAEWLRREVEG